MATFLTVIPITTFASTIIGRLCYGFRLCLLPCTATTLRANGIRPRLVLDIVININLTTTITIPYIVLLHIDLFLKLLVVTQEPILFFFRKQMHRIATGAFSWTQTTLLRRPKEKRQKNPSQREKAPYATDGFRIRLKPSNVFLFRSRINALTFIMLK